MIDLRTITERNRARDLEAIRKERALSTEREQGAVKRFGRMGE